MAPQQRSNKQTTTAHVTCARVISIGSAIKESACLFTKPSDDECTQNPSGMAIAANRERAVACGTSLGGIAFLLEKYRPRAH